MGDENNAAIKLEKFWRDLANKDLYSHWNGGYFYNLHF